MLCGPQTVTKKINKPNSVEVIQASCNPNGYNLTKYIK